ncbi:matrix protein [Isfahan virus]|uniref:Matrix protein n=1 Tax=Isfahan virus TaxID=290008 RepID=MATRX_ISFV|nr:matrix protein [Isfahan virus]Q5K2K5.1 RecName: Full=Matrix protein [Isfahan virus]CAH17546.1 matrix protein [Isfahan virus]
MKSLKRLIKSNKKKGDKKNVSFMDWDEPPSYSDSRYGCYPSAPLFGVDEMMETLPTLGIQSLKIQYKCSLQVRAETPFTSFNDAARCISLWETDYRGYAGKKPFYRLLMLIATKKLRAAPMSLMDGNRPEYSSMIQGQSIVHHSLGVIPPMMHVPETFTREWNLLTNKGMITAQIWLGITDVVDDLNPLINPALFSDEKEMTLTSQMFGLELKKRNDNTWLISKSY